MKSLADSTRNNLLQQKLKSNTCYSYTRVTYIDDDEVEQEFSDAQYPIRISKKGEPPKYANTNYNPATAEVDFNVINKDGPYSPKNTDSTQNDILKRDRIFKFYDGKWLNSVESTDTETLDLDALTLLYTQKATDSDGDTIAIGLDQTNAEGNDVDYFQDSFTLYDAEDYDSFTYAPDGYAVWTIDRDYSFTQKFSALSVTANTDKIKVYWRSNNTQEGYENAQGDDNWRLLGTTSNGTTTFTPDKRMARYVQIAFVWDTGDWDDTAQISAATASFENYVEWVLLGTFYIDDPRFQDKQSPSISTVKITGRNAYKRALETKINIGDLSGGGGTDIDDLIKSICDLSDITYSATSIASLSSFGARTLAGGYDDEVSIDVIFTDIMDIIGKTYKMYISDDNILYVTLRPTNYLADWVQNFKRYINAQQEEVSEKQLQRFTIITSQGVPDATILLDSDTYTAAGEETLTWVGDAIFKYPIISYGSDNVDGVITSIKFTNTSAVIVITGSNVDIDVSIYGSAWKSGAPTYSGEAANIDNIVNIDGFRSTNVNPLPISDAEIKTITEDRISEFGSPAYDVVITDSFLNPLPELNDQNLVVSEDFFEDTLYEVGAIDYVLESETKKYTIYSLSDTGRKYTDQGPLVWDRDYYGTAPAAQWDSGIIWDANHRIGASKSEILTDTPKVFNVDFN